MLTTFAVGLTMAGALLAGCSSAPDPGPRFDNEGAQQLTCMRHQPTMPGARYTDVAHRRTDETLPLLRYYTSNAAKPYCDGAPPTDIDRRWAQLYVDLGADRATVANLLG